MEQTIDPRKTALLVIDMQNDFIEDSAVLEVKGIRENLESFKSFIDTCRSKGMSVVYTKHEYSPEENPIEAELFPEMNDIGLRRGSDGFEINKIIAPHNGDMVIEKKRYDAFYGSSLEEMLRARGITDVIISGTMGNVCCDSTARGAMYRDFHVWFLSDLTFTSDPMVHEYTLKTMATHFGQVVDSENIKTMLS